MKKIILMLYAFFIVSACSISSGSNITEIQMPNIPPTMDTGDPILDNSVKNALEYLEADISGKTLWQHIITNKTDQITVTNIFLGNDNTYVMIGVQKNPPSI